MLNDKIFRQFKVQPFQQSYNGFRQFEEFRETLMINEIIKCGNQILGAVDMSIDQANNTTPQQQQNRTSSLRTSSQKNKKQQYNYIYHYDYGKSHLNQTKNLPDESDSPIDEISFTLSNEDNKPQEINHEQYQQKHISQKRIQWKDNLIEQNIQSQKNQHQKHPKNHKNAQNLKNAKTFSKFLSNPIQFSPLPSKKHSHTPPNQIKSYLDKQSGFKQQKYKTPQKVTKTSKKTLKTPLSQQITKNVYGKLKIEVQDMNFLQEYKQRQKEAQEENEQKWKGFIQRSEKWTDEKKNHLIQMQMTQKYPSHRNSRSKSKNNTQSQYSSYVSLQVQQRPNQHSSKYLTVRNNLIFPQDTFKKSRISPEKRQSSVENCINKLKTQTQLLKVKLLSPLKQKIKDNTEIQHYKQLNQSDSRKSIKKYRQNYEQKAFAKTTSTLIHVKNLYGKCINEKPSK